MFLLSVPTTHEVELFIAARNGEVFSYTEVGATASEIPAGYNIDHNRQLLGRGAKYYERAIAAIHSWKMFNLPWVELISTQTPIETGRTVAITVKHYGFYSLNAARIVYTIDEGGDLNRFGFAYGTLLEHGEIGEERFMVEYDHRSGEVWYDILAFSRPASLLAKLGYPLTRGLQKQFAGDSKAAMLQAVSGVGDTLPAGRIVLK
jgi:uncharacterized protein (UPF0548 family)